MTASYQSPDSTPWRVSIRDPIAWTLGLGVFAALLLLAPQGLDVTDMGFWLTAYEQFRTRPETMGIMTASWLSVLIGHGIAVLTGGSVLAFKMAHAALTALTAVLAWATLAPRLLTDTGRLRALTLAASLAVVALLSRSVHGNWIGYNDIGAFLHLLGASLLLKGLLDNRLGALVGSGVVIGLNTYTRLPNVTGIALLAVIWFHGALNGLDARSLLGRSARMVTGWLIGLGIGAVLIGLFGHERLYLAQVQGLFELARESNSTHAGSGLLKQFVSNHLTALREGVAVLAAGGVLAWAVAGRSVALRGGVTVGMALGLYWHINHAGRAEWAVPGLVGVVLLAILARARRHPDLAVLAAVAGALILLVPLGSNTGIAKANYGLWLAMPLALGWLLGRPSTVLTAQLDETRFHPNIVASLRLDAPVFQVLAVAGLLGLALHVAERAVRHTYLDSTHRRDMIHSIAHRKLSGTFTTAVRAQAVSELLAAMPRCAQPGEPLLAYNAIPLIHVLTDTRPWLDDSWPDLMVTPRQLAQRLDSRAIQGERLPCIVRARLSTYDRDWPNPNKPPVDWWRQGENRALFQAFEARHGYRVIWSNDSFEILLPGQVRSDLSYPSALERENLT